MRVFGTKQIEPTHEDRAAAARLNALAARFKPQPYGETVTVTEAVQDAPQPVAE